MGSIQAEQNYDHLRDVLGNIPMAKSYTVACLFFLLKETTSIAEVTESLKQALARLSAAYPYLAGGVYFEGKADGVTGKSKIVPLRDSIELVVKNFREDSSIPSMAEFSKAGYPFSLLDGGVLSPCAGIPIPFEESEENPAPVLVLQANFVKGGLILTFAGNHVTMDMNGMGKLICLFSKACLQEPFSETEIKQGNQSRTNAIPLFGDDYVAGPEMDDVRARPHNPPDVNEPKASPLWAYFNISVSNIMKLKEEASKQTSVPYITANDAISAFVWQHVAKARQSRLGSNVKSHICRGVNARKHLGLDDLYFGHVVECAEDSEVDVWTHPLGELAGRLRKTLQDTDILHHVRGLATLLDRAADKTQYIYAAHFDFGKDLMISSWSQIPCCQLSYGPLLGVPEAMRRPRFVPFGGLAYTMPKAKDGSVAVAMCLREDDMDKLKEDTEFTSYAEYVG